MNKKTLSYTRPSASKPRDSRAGFPSRVAPNHTINLTIDQVYQIQNYGRGIPLHVVESPAFAQLRSRSRCWYISRARTRYPLHGGNSNLKHVIISVSGTLPSFAQSLRWDMPPQWAIGLCWDGELDVALSFANALKYTDWSPTDFLQQNGYVIHYYRAKQTCIKFVEISGSQFCPKTDVCEESSGWHERLAIQRELVYDA